MHILMPDFVTLSHLFLRYSNMLIHLAISLYLDLKIPPVIEQEVRKQNMEFLHNRIQFSNEYFEFIRKLVTVNINIDSVSV